MRFDAGSARCDVYTFKRGLLSAVAHDLRIAVTGFSVDVGLDAAGGPSLDARFEAASLRVVCAVRDGVDAPELLGARDRTEIEKHIVDDVLEARRFPVIRFQSSAIAVEGGGHRVVGRLSLHGVERELRFETKIEAADEIAEVRLHQPDFGIRPYSALLGTLRVSDDVIVRVRLPLARQSP